MHNRIGFNRLGRKSSHRKALHRNMVTSLIKYERIKTTKAKAKEIRKTAEKLVTRAKVDSVHNRRVVGEMIGDKDQLNKLFTEISPRFMTRPGGYTRILKLGMRPGDAAEMVILEFVKDEEATDGKKKPKKKTESKKKPAVKATAKRVKAPKAEKAPKEEIAEAGV
jgi:large subunit ribosomal protein L17